MRSTGYDWSRFRSEPLYGFLYDSAEAFGLIVRSWPVVCAAILAYMATLLIMKLLAAALTQG